MAGEQRQLAICSEDLDALEFELEGGEGAKRPKDGDSVLVRLRATSGTDPAPILVLDDLFLEYTIGKGQCVTGPPQVAAAILDRCLVGASPASGAGPVAPGLVGMRPGAIARVTVPAGGVSGGFEAGCGELSLTVTLERICEECDALAELTQAMSLCLDGWRLRKRVLREGEKGGDKAPGPGDLLAFRVSELRLQGVALEVPAEDQQIIIGSGEVCEALEFGLSQMRLGEKARLLASLPLVATRPPVAAMAVAAAEGGGDVEAEIVVELLGFERQLQKCAGETSRLLQWGKDHKDIGGELFKSHRYVLALLKYLSVSEHFMMLDLELQVPPGERFTEGKSLELICRLNAAQCLLNLGEWSAAAHVAGEVLQTDAKSVKAHWRKAQAKMKTGDFKEARQLLLDLLKLEPGNAPARKLLQEATEKWKAENSRDKERLKRVMQKSIEEEVCTGGREAHWPDPEKAREQAMYGSGPGGCYQPGMSPMDLCKTMNAQGHDRQDCMDVMDKHLKKRQIDEIKEQYGTTEDEAIRIRDQGGL